MCIIYIVFYIVIQLHKKYIELQKQKFKNSQQPMYLTAQSHNEKSPERKGRFHVYSSNLVKSSLKVTQLTSSIR